MREERRIDIVWSGAEIANFEAMKKEAERHRLSLQEFAKKAIEAFLGGGA